MFSVCVCTHAIAEVTGQLMGVVSLNHVCSRDQIQAVKLNEHLCLLSHLAS